MKTKTKMWIWTALLCLSMIGLMISAFTDNIVVDILSVLFYATSQVMTSIYRDKLNDEINNDVNESLKRFKSIERKYRK